VSQSKDIDKPASRATSSVADVEAPRATRMRIDLTRSTAASPPIPRCSPTTPQSSASDSREGVGRTQDERRVQLADGVEALAPRTRVRQGAVEVVQRSQRSVRARQQQREVAGMAVRPGDRVVERQRVKAGARPSPRAGELGVAGRAHRSASAPGPRRVRTSATPGRRAPGRSPPGERAAIDPSELDNAVVADDNRGVRPVDQRLEPRFCCAQPEPSGRSKASHLERVELLESRDGRLDDVSRRDSFRTGRPTARLA
jgi:hypothetical protein